MLRNRFSAPLAKIQLMTVAPYFSILTEAPEGCFMVTEFSFCSIAMTSEDETGKGLVNVVLNNVVCRSTTACDPPSAAGHMKQLLR